MAAPNNPAGNNNKVDKIWRDALMRAVKRQKDKGGSKYLEILADKTVNLGLEGNINAIKEIGDRLDGKPAQGVDHSGNMTGSFTILSGVPERADD